MGKGSNHQRTKKGWGIVPFGAYIIDIHIRFILTILEVYHHTPEY